VCDVTGHDKEAKALIATVSGTSRSSSKKRTVNVAGTPALVFDLPKEPGKTSTSRRSTPFVQQNNLLVVSDDLAVMEGVLNRASGKAGNSLADVPAFRPSRTVESRRRQDDAQVRWFIQPLGYLELMRTLRAIASAARGSRGRRVQDSRFTAIQGSRTSLGVEKYELVHARRSGPPPASCRWKIISFRTASSSFRSRGFRQSGGYSVYATSQRLRHLGRCLTTWSGG